MRTARTLLVLAVALLIATAVVAQEKPKKKGRRGKLSPTTQAVVRIDRLRHALEELDLTEAQKEDLKKLHEEFGPKMKAIFEKMQEVLTEEQKAAGEEAMKEAKESGKKGREFFQAIEASLKLTGEQKEKMDKLAPEISAVQKEMMKEIRGILTPEQQEKLKEKMQSPRKKKPKEGQKKKAE
jgi:Spy/CpxP family protein refolding chaperone